jgi:hypothetical protein
MQKANSIGEQDQGLTPDTEEAFTEYMMKEFKRRREGVWFMNNGEPVYHSCSLHGYAMESNGRNRWL